MPTKIEWCDETWNPVTGCTPISEGCEHCYARRMATRLRGRCGYQKHDPFKPMFHPDRMNDPLRWRKPRRVFVCSMGDLFHEYVPIEWIAHVFGTMARLPQHIFMILTKRPERMRDLIDGTHSGKFCAAIRAIYPNWMDPVCLIGRNVWLGVTAENQRTADERIPVLLQIPAAVRFVSVEPMLEPVDLIRVAFPHGGHENVLRCDVSETAKNAGIPKLNGIDWVICGGETGPGARTCDTAWCANLATQCENSGVPFFFKKPGGNVEYSECEAKTRDWMRREWPKEESKW